MNVLANQYWLTPESSDVESISQSFKSQGYEIQEQFRGSDLAAATVGPIESQKLQPVVEKTLSSSSNIRGVFVSPDEQHARDMAQRLTGQRNPSSR